MSEDDEQLPPDMQEFERQLLDNMVPEEKLLAAAQSGHGSVVKDLLIEGTPILVNENGTTALHQAAQGGFADVIQILLDHGADIDSPDSEGYTALHKAAGKGHLDVLGLLINEGCQIDLQDQTYGNTALHEAAWKGFSKSVDLLLKNKSNAFIANRAGCTALHLAAQSGHNQSGRALIYAGCSPDVKNNYGDTPLHTAARYGHAGIARILISARCSVSEQNKNGDTSLHIAAAFKRRKIATLLVEGGINVQLANKQGETATDIARRKDHMSIIEIIHRGHAQPTAGVRLRSASDLSKTQSSQPTLSRETTPEVSRDSKKKSGLVSWIKKKFAKEKLEKERMGQSLSNLNRPDDEDDGNLGLFSQYVKRQGFAYYRDLAGNIRQGPVGYVPNCHCEASRRTSGLDPILDYKDTQMHTHTHNHHKLSERLKRLELGPDLELATQARLLAEKHECLERLRKLTEHERQRHIEKDEAKTRDDLHSWLATQISESKESDPFGYSIGTKQQRFGDDFDHERIARYETINSEQFPPPPRLFRSRSDETLTHSEYSFHGRAFKSREAAMEELKILKHHSEIRERRKLIRAGLKEQELRASQANLIRRQSAHSNSAEVDSKRKSALWMSREDLNEEDSKNDASKLHDTFSREQANGHLKNRVARKKSTEGAVSTTNSQTQPERVLGRRERSISPDRKSTLKASTAMPLKSAMRQPRRQSASDEKSAHVYRSNSLPRDTRIEFRKENADSNGPKKTVRYDETVKSTEIAQDMPPSVSPAQAEEVFLPAKREAPIGGHDEKYSENTPPILPAYQKPTDEGQSKDLRDSIVNARKQLLARKPETVKTQDRHNENYRPANGNGLQENSNLRNPNSQQPQIGKRLHSEPQVGRRQQGETRALYHSQDTLRPSQKPAVPFRQYANANPTLPEAANRNNQAYYSTSLSRPAKQTDSQAKAASNERRMPLPSYEEIQSSRMGIRKPSNVVNQVRTPPNYQRKVETSSGANLTNGTFAQQTIPSSLQPGQYLKYPNQHITGINNGHLNSQTISSNQHATSIRTRQQPVPVPQVNVTQNQTSNLANPPRQVGRSNSLHNSASKQAQHHNNTHFNQLPTNQQHRTSVAAYQQQIVDETTADLTSANNTGSCSSSNPDSGYSGNFYDTNSNSVTSSTDYNTWYQQSIQSAALKMTAMTENRPMSRGLPQKPVANKSTIQRSMPPASHQRIVYTNLTSDV